MQLAGVICNMFNVLFEQLRKFFSNSSNELIEDDVVLLKELINETVPTDNKIRLTNAQIGEFFHLNSADDRFLVFRSHAIWSQGSNNPKTTNAHRFFRNLEQQLDCKISVYISVLSKDRCNWCLTIYFND